MRRIVVCGLGLIGGSAALALDADGYDLDPDVRARARQRGIETGETLYSAVGDAEIVLIAVPTAETPALLRRISSLAPEALLTDAASIKVPIAEAAAALPEDTRFVGGHPMAGGHRGGIEAASRDLFRGRPWALTPTARSDAESIARVSELVREAGGRPIILDAERHDRAMTWVSHLPYALATALTRAAKTGAGADLADLAGPGFLDTTRVAGQSLSLAMELALARPGDLADALDAVGGELSELSTALRRGDTPAVRAFFEKAAEVRRELDATRRKA